MRPTTRELIEAVVSSLQRDVSPHLADKWGASALRSAVQLLQHVAVRVEKEAALLIEDNADVRRVLRSTRERLAASRSCAAWCRAIDEVLAVQEPAAHDTVGLDRHNEACQDVVELLLRDRQALHAARSGREIHAELRSYLRRRLEREHTLYFPAFTGAPF
jgi:hypothetical protein